MLARLGSRVRLRIVNLGMITIPFTCTQPVRGHRHGRRPRSGVHLVPMNTVLVGVAQARVIEFDAKYPARGWCIAICRTT